MRRTHDARTTFQSRCVSRANTSYLAWQPTFFHTSGSHLTRCRQFRATSLENQQSRPVWFSVPRRNKRLSDSISSSSLSSCFSCFGKKKKKKMYVQCSIVRFVMKTKQKNPFHLCRVLMKVMPMWRVRASYSCGGSHSNLIHISVDFSRTAAITLPSRLYLSEVCIPVYLLLNHSVLALCLTALAINPLCVILLGLREIKEHWRAGLKLQPRAKYQFH